MLGDIFDWWVGDDQMRDPVRRRRRQVDARHRCCRRSRCTSGNGNRDFLIGERLAKAAGATLLPDFVLLDLHGVRTLLCHGDSCAPTTSNTRRIARACATPRCRRACCACPTSCARIIAAWLRRKSRNTKALKPESIMDVSIATVERTFRDRDAARMIHGHTHRPAVHVHDVDGKKRERIVLADWGIGRKLSRGQRGRRRGAHDLSTRERRMSKASPSGVATMPAATKPPHPHSLMPPRTWRPCRGCAS